MTRSRLLTPLFGLLALLAAPGVAHAQDGVDWGGLMGGIAHDSAAEEMARGSSRAERYSRDRFDPSPLPRQEVGRLTFRPSMERRRANIAQFVQRTRKRDPEGAAELQRI